MKRHHLFLLAGLFAVAVAFAFTRKHQYKTNHIKDTKPGFALVELYTSEGCSSCPPADQLLARIQQEYKDKEVYVLAYHVDYWDRLGWKDVFSSPAYSQRQRAYSGYLNLDGVYTPQAIVNGTTEFVGSDDSKMQAAIRQGLAKNATTTLNLTATKLTGTKATLQYQITGSLQNNSLMLAVVQKYATTQVKAGENGGRTLPHVNIVHQLQSFTAKEAAGNVEVNLPEGFTTKEWRIIGFVQNTRNGEIQAARQVVLNDKETASLK